MPKVFFERPVVNFRHHVKWSAFGVALHAISFALAWFKLGDVGGILILDPIGPAKVSIGAFEAVDVATEMGAGKCVPARHGSWTFVFGHKLTSVSVLVFRVSV